MASIDITQQTVIKCNLPFAWEYMAEPLNIPDWNANILTAKWKSPKPMKVGTRIACSAKFMGRPVDYTFEVKTLEPESKYSMASIDGPFPMEVKYSLALLFEGTVRVTVTQQAEPAGAFKLVGGMIKSSMTTALEKDLATLKGILERRFKEKSW